MTPLKGFKITNATRSKTVGLASNSLADLMEKACKKFHISKCNASLYLGDGTLVDSEEYFATIPPQSVLCLIGRGEKLLTGADLIYNALKMVNIQYLKVGEQALDFLQDDIKNKVHVLSEAVKSHEKEEAFEFWAKGVETTCKTKEAFMERRCKDRIKGYFYKACADIKSSPQYKTHSAELSRLIGELKRRLSRKGFQGVYFNRSKRSEALCDEAGLFRCQGVWSKPKCSYCGGLGHSINPYLSWETRVVFSTWNLDHRIERSRSIVPSVLKATSLLADGFSLNVERIYDLLFTTANLKLVHVVCHDKGAHTTATCEPDELLRSIEPSSKKSDGLNSRQMTIVSRIS